jgi:hypothetical protein
MPLLHPLDVPVRTPVPRTRCLLALLAEHRGELRALAVRVYWPEQEELVMARTVEQIRIDRCKGNPTCPECGQPSYAKRFVGSTDRYFSCSANGCYCLFLADGRTLGLGGISKK